MAVLVERDGKLLFVRRPPSGLWGGLWEPPWRAAGGDEGHAPIDDAAAARVAKRCTGLALTNIQSIGTFEHVLTHRRMQFHVFAARGRGRVALDGYDAARWRSARRGARRRRAGARRGGMDAPHSRQGDDMSKVEAAAVKLKAAYEQILEAFDDLGYPVKTDANFAETASRAAKAMIEMVKPTDEIKSKIDEMLSRTFPAQYDEMVISKHNISFGMCPHHLLPVIYRISVAYLPGERVLGISKLSRMVHLLVASAGACRRT